MQLSGREYVCNSQGKLWFVRAESAHDVGNRTHAIRPFRKLLCEPKRGLLIPLRGRSDDFHLRLPP